MLPLKDEETERTREEAEARSAGHGATCPTYYNRCRGGRRARESTRKGRHGRKLSEQFKRNEAEAERNGNKTDRMGTERRNRSKGEEKRRGEDIEESKNEAKIKLSGAETERTERI